jgi:7-cyano-7-deazaguanine reductase
MHDDTSRLTKLGDHKTVYQYTHPHTGMLEVFENQYPQRWYTTIFNFNEFTSLCPKTGQPDFAHITIECIPDKLCIETKSLKIYFLAYRNQGAFMETIVNQILEDCVMACNPRRMKVTGNFNARGGTLITVYAEYQKPNETD